MSEQSIYLRLRRAGLSAPGACALMGNMKAESAMKSSNVQDCMGYSDADYTAAADAGLVDFVSDGRGYGLCQWTYGARKRALLDFARSRGVSVGDEDMQVDFCVAELRQDYPALWLYLCSCKGVYEAAGRVCSEYERPAVSNTKVRAAYANEFYMRLGGLDPASPEAGELTRPEEPATPSPERESRWPPRVLSLGMYGGDVAALQGLLIAHGYPAGVSGVFDAATAEKLMAFQRGHGLADDGVAGKRSWQKLTEGAA